ncbi:HAMP domain-containing protein, partial [bacterium]|nr:HAMP domain-containing protein [bacterium]
AGLGIRGIAPVSYNAEHIGAVEFGLNLDQKLLDTFKEDFGFDFQMGISQEAAKLTTFVASDLFADLKSDQIVLQASTLEEPFLASANNYIQALNGIPTLEHLTIDNREYAILTVPIIDFSGNVVGTLDIISDHTEIAVQQRQQIFISIGILLASLLAVGVGFYLIAGRTLRPISTLTASANAIAAGDFTQTAKVESDDELGVLATTFNSMAAQIEENVRTLEDRVAARTKNLATVAEIATATATIIDTDKMLARMVHLTQRGFGLYHAHVFTYDVNTEDLQIVVCGYREGDEHEGTHGTTSIPLSQEQSLVARAARLREAVIV